MEYGHISVRGMSSTIMHSRKPPLIPPHHRMYIHVGSFVTPQISGAPREKEHSSRRAKEAAKVILNKQDHLAPCKQDERLATVDSMGV